MHAGEIVSESLKGLNTAHAQEVFLSHAGVVVPTVESRTEAYEFWRVVGMVGVQEIHRNEMASNAHHIGFPHVGIQGGTVEWELDAFSGVDQVFSRVDGAVCFGLLAVDIEMLSAITFSIEKADGHERNFCIGG
jgi:hypothetical protein